MTATDPPAVPATPSTHSLVPVVLQAVDEVEALTLGLSRKIWQKIVILDAPEPQSRV